MQSNGFGSVEQKIVVHVPNEYAKQFALRLEANPYNEESDSARSYFVWNRWTTRPGNDEDVVFALYALLTEEEHSIDWKIDWEASDY